MTQEAELKGVISNSKIQIKNNNKRRRKVILLLNLIKKNQKREI
jgi:hypothetical protein